MTKMLNRHFSILCLNVDAQINLEMANIQTVLDKMRILVISQPNIDGFCSNLVFFKAHGATETEIMPKHFGRKPYGRNNGRYYGRKAYGRTLPNQYVTTGFSKRKLHLKCKNIFLNRRSKRFNV